MRNRSTICWTNNLLAFRVNSSLILRSLTVSFDELHPTIACVSMQQLQVKSEWPKQRRRRTYEGEKVRTVKSFSGSSRWNRTDPPTTIFHICSQESLACVIGWLVKSKAELRKRKDKIRVSAIEISHIFWHEIRRWRWSLLSYSGNALRRSLHSTRTEISSRQKSNKHCQIFSFKKQILMHELIFGFNSEYFQHPGELDDWRLL